MNKSHKVAKVSQFITFSVITVLQKQLVTYFRKQGIYILPSPRTPLMSRYSDLGGGTFIGRRYTYVTTLLLPYLLPPLALLCLICSGCLHTPLP